MPHRSAPTSNAADAAASPSNREQRRLCVLSRHWAPATLRMLSQAGIEPGMRVLDVGCGSGDVSLLTASLVGRSGSVVGVDRSADAIARATERGRDEEMTNVRFLVGELDRPLEIAGHFDAIVGRFVLMYLPDPVATLRSLYALLRPGGTAAFVEMDIEVMKSVPHTPLMHNLTGWIVNTLVCARIATTMGPRVWAALDAAGYSSPVNSVWWEAAPAPAAEATQVLTEMTRKLLPLIEECDVIDRAAVDIDHLQERLQAELLAAHAALMPPAIVGTWARRPA
jgi:ubiquinone/menaquinone biosynthesis C-methylase UbiE